MKPPTKPRQPEHGEFPIREDRVERIEVHVAGVCLLENAERWYALAAKRTADRHLYPNLWECGGGMVRSGEGFRAALARQMFEEFGLTVDPWFLVEDYEIHVPPPQKIIPGVRFACRAREGSVRLNPREFAESRWLALPLEESLDWIPGIREALDRVAARLASSEGLRE